MTYRVQPLRPPLRQQLRDDGVLARVEGLVVEQLAATALEEQDADEAIDPVVQGIDRRQHAFLVKEHEACVRVGLVLVRPFAAGVEEREVGVDVLEVVARQRERGVFVTGGLQQGRFDHAPDPAIAIPEGVDEFVVVMHQRRADERVGACIHQLAVPGDQCFEQAPDVAPVLWRLVAPAVLRTADLGDAPLGVVADEAGAVVGVRQIVGDQSVHLGHEVDRQLPARIERSLSCAFVGGLDVEHPPLLDLLHLRGIEVDGGACFILGERAAFDRVGPVDAAGDHLALELIRHLRERRGDEAPMGILDALHRKLQAASVDAHLKEEGAEAVGFDAQRELGNLGGDHVCRNVRSKKQGFILFSIR